MSLDRRLLLAAGAGLGTAAIAAGVRTAEAGPQPERMPARPSGTHLAPPSSDGRHAAALQSTIDALASSGGGVLSLAPGTWRLEAPLMLRPGVRLVGAGPTTRFVAITERAFTGQAAARAGLEALAIEAAAPEDKPAAATPSSLVGLQDCDGLALREIMISGAAGNGVALERCSGVVSHCEIAESARAGLHALDSKGLQIVHCLVRDCADNGILVWTSRPAEDGTLVAHNRIERIAARSGGSGQYGNGVNVFRAGAVRVEGNRIADCAYSAVRGNAASNIAIAGNTCARIGEVALYAEFAFEGASIVSNIVDGAATGISVTNFNEGGRLAVVHGNLVRNLYRREHEPEDKRGEGIMVEADAVVSGNVIEGAPSTGILLGWGRYLRDVVVTGNLVRASRIGIGVQADRSAGSVLIANNMISGAREGAIRAMRLAEPTGPDLARAAAGAPSHVALAGNVAA